MSFLKSFQVVTNIEETRELPKNPKLSMQFIEILKSIGYVLTLEDDIEDIDTTDEPVYDEFDEDNFNNIIKKEKNNATESDD